MMTKVKTALLAKKLRERIAELKKEHTAGLDAFHKALKKWRADMGLWVASNATKRIADISVNDIRNASNRYVRSAGFSTDDFFHGAPKPPTYPSDKTVRKAQSLLRQIAMTGQAFVNLSTEEVSELFGDSGIEE